MDLATLQIKVDATGAVRSIKEFNNTVDDSAKKTAEMEKWAKRAGIAIGAALGTAAVLGMRKLINETIVAQNAQAQLAAALRSTAGASGQTIDSLNKQSAALQRMSTFGDDAIASAQSLLLTFTKISGETFPRATQAIVDMSTRMGGDLQGAAIQVGKALNDPIEGISALSRVGVSFSDSQKEVIKSLAETGRLAEAQAIVLKELEVEFGGSAEAARNTFGGALTALSNAWGDLFEVSSDATEGIVASINRITDALPRMRDTMGEVVRVMGIKATELQLIFSKSDRAIAQSNATLYAALNVASGGALGGAGMVRSAAEVARLDAEISALEQLKTAQELALAAANNYAAGVANVATALAAQNAQAGAAVGGTGRARLRALPAPGAMADRLGGAGNSAKGLAETILTTDKNAMADKLRALTDAANEMADASKMVTENFLRGLQGTFTNFFRDLFTDGISSFRGLMESFKNLVLNTVAELASKRLMGAIFGGAGGGGLGGLLGGLSGGALLGIGVGAFAVSKLLGNNGAREGYRKPAGVLASRPNIQANDIMPRGSEIRSSVGSALQEGTAVRLFGTFEAMRQSLVNIEGLLRNGALMGNGTSSSGLDKALGTRSQSLRLAAGVAVVG